MKAILTILLFSAWLPLQAQQGGGARSLLAAASVRLVAAPATNAPRYWLWESDAQSFAVYTGISRNLATNRIVVKTNHHLWRSNTVIAVAPISTNGVEFAKVFHPSNSIYVPVAYMSSDLLNWKKVAEFPEVTNTPMKFLRIVNEFKRFE